MLSLYRRPAVLPLICKRIVQPRVFYLCNNNWNVNKCHSRRLFSTQSEGSPDQKPTDAQPKSILQQFTESFLRERREINALKDLLAESNSDKIAKHFEGKALDKLGTPLHQVVRLCEVPEIQKALTLPFFKNLLNTKNASGHTPIFLAQNLEAMNLLIENGADPTVRDNSGYTYLHYVAQLKMPEMARVLISNKQLDVNAKSKEGLTPLHVAAIRGSGDMIRLLVELGANLETRDATDSTPLLRAVRSDNNYERVFTLCQLGANVNTIAENSVTPIVIAAILGNANVVGLLASRGANLNFDDGSGTALHNAAQRGHLEIVSLLLQCGAKIQESNQKLTPLHVAASAGNLEVIELLVKSGNKVDARDYADYTPLGGATLAGHTKAVELLAKLGADVQARNVQGRTPLHLAKSYDMIETLVRLGAKMNAKDNDGSTPLVLAIRVGEFGKLESLVKAGAQIDELDDKGYTPLQLAIAFKETNPIGHLIKAGANVNGVSTKTEPPLHIAAKLETPDVVAELLKYKPNVNQEHAGWTPLFNVGHPDTVKLLVNAGANVNFRTSLNGPVVTQGSTPLHALSYQKSAPVVRAIVECGAALEAVNLHGHTALMFACINPNYNVYKTLVELGANVKHLDVHGNTLLHHAVERTNLNAIDDLLKNHKYMWNYPNKMRQRGVHCAATTGQVAILQIFVQLGADIKEPDSAGDTPMHYAVNARSLPMVQELLRLGADLEPVNAMGWTPVVFAGFADATLIPFFVEHGANINRQDKNGNTPMHLAIIHAGNAASVKAFMHAGADLYIKNAQGRNVIEEGAARGFRIIV